VVVVPVYNEAAVITEVVVALRHAFDHVVCVDDGSVDRSVQLAAAAGATVLAHPVNLGQGAALQTGLDYALGTDAHYVITFDSDGQHHVDDALRLLEAARTSDVDIVLGSRFLGSDHHVPSLRLLVLRAAVRFTRLTSGLRLSDAHNGLRVLTRDAAAMVDLHQAGMAHASELIGLVARHRLRYCEVPMTVAYTEYSRAKGQSSLNAVNIVVDLLLARARYAR
jgi:glycosyltransferase involved in cell wall biosynthesis